MNYLLTWIIQHSKVWILAYSIKNICLTLFVFLVYDFLKLEFYFVWNKCLSRFEFRYFYISWLQCFLKSSFNLTGLLIFLIEQGAEQKALIFQPSEECLLSADFQILNAAFHFPLTFANMLCCFKIKWFEKCIVWNGLFKINLHSFWLKTNILNRTEILHSWLKSCLVAVCYGKDILTFILLPCIPDFP